MSIRIVQLISIHNPLRRNFTFKIIFKIKNINHKPFINIFCYSNKTSQPTHTVLSKQGITTMHYTKCSTCYFLSQFVSFSLEISFHIQGQVVLLFAMFVAKKKHTTQTHTDTNKHLQCILVKLVRQQQQHTRPDFVVCYLLYSIWKQ